MSLSKMSFEATAQEVVNATRIMQINNGDCSLLEVDHLGTLGTPVCRAVQK